MKINEFIYSEVEANELLLNKYEVSARLKTSVGFKNDLIEKCECDLREKLSCKFIATRVQVNINKDNILDLGFGNIQSKSLYNYLLNSKEAFILAVTLGHKVDQYLRTLSIISPAEYFISDGLASSFAESLADYAELKIIKNCKTKHRFSPGYGDLSLNVQPSLLKKIEAYKYLNITLNDMYFMHPTKSITAIIGIE